MIALPDELLHFFLMATLKGSSETVLFAAWQKSFFPSADAQVTFLSFFPSCCRLKAHAAIGTSIEAASAANAAFLINADQLLFIFTDCVRRTCFKAGRRTAVLAHNRHKITMQSTVFIFLFNFDDINISAAFCRHVMLLFAGNPACHTAPAFINVDNHI